MIKKLLGNNNGSATLLALVIVIFLTMLSAGVMALATQSVKVSANYSDGLQAQNAAEAGVQDALVNIKDPEVRIKHKDETKVEVAQTNISTDVTYEYSWEKATYNGEEAYIITSTGTVWSEKDSKKILAKRQIVATAVIRNKPACYVGEDMTWDGMFDGGTTGATIATGKLSIDDIHKKNGYTQKKYNNVTFTNTDVPLEPYPYETTKFADIQADNKNYELLESGNLLDGKGAQFELSKMDANKNYIETTYYHNGDITIKAPGMKAAAPTTIYVNGQVSLEGGSIDGNITIVVLKDGAGITINNPNEADGINKGQPNNTLKLYAPGEIIVNPACGGKLVVWSKTKVTLNGNADVNAEIHSEQDVIINSNVVGQVYAKRNLNLTGSGTLDLVTDTNENEKIVLLVKWATPK